MHLHRPALTLTSIAALLLVAACGSDDAGDAAAGSGEDGQITLTIATFNEFGYEELLEQYEADNPNITIEHKKAATTNEARDNLTTRLAAGSGLADIEAIEVDWLAELMQYPDQFVDLAGDDIEGRWLDWKTAPATTDDGRLVGFGTDIGPEAVCYRADLFEEAGLPSDRESVADLLGDTWEDYFDAGRQFAENSDVPWFDSAQANYLAMINQVEYAFENADGEIIATENPEVREIYDTVLEASVDDGLSAHLGQWSDDWTKSFQSDGFATMLCPAWLLGVIEGNAEGVEGWDVADTFPGGGGNWGGSYLTVPTQSEHPEAARELAAWLTSPEQQLAAFESKGTFPSQADALESDDLLGSTNAFFNDAPTGEIFSNRAQAIDVQPYKGEHYFAISDAMQQALARVDVDGTDDAESSWQKFVDAVEALG